MRMPYLPKVRKITGLEEGVSKSDDGFRGREMAHQELGMKVWNGGQAD